MFRMAPTTASHGVWWPSRAMKPRSIFRMSTGSSVSRARLL